MLGPSRCELTHHAWYQSSTFMFRVLPSGINPPSLVQASAQGTKPGGFIFFLQRCLPPRQKHGELGTECRENFKLTHAAWHQSAVRAARGAMEPSQGGQGGQAKEAREAKEGKGRSHAPQAPRKPQCAPRATEALQAARAPRAPRIPSAPHAPRASTRPTQTTRILRAPCAACATRTPHAACDLCAFPAL